MNPAFNPSKKELFLSFIVIVLAFVLIPDEATVFDLFVV